MADVDYVNRDPSGVNSHLQAISFNDVIAEPDGTHSLDCLWGGAAYTFECWKKLCYTLMTTCFGICIAAEWGCEFAYIAFWHIWYITPLIKVYELNCGVWKRMYSICLGCCLEPFCEAMGSLFVHFKK